MLGIIIFALVISVLAFREEPPAERAFATVGTAWFLQIWLGYAFHGPHGVWSEEALIGVAIRAVLAIPVGFGFYWWFKRQRTPKALDRLEAMRLAEVKAGEAAVALRQTRSQRIEQRYQSAGRIFGQFLRSFARGRSKWALYAGLVLLLSIYSNWQRTGLSPMRHLRAFL
jgi:hypothetical protein